MSDASRFAPPFGGGAFFALSALPAPSFAGVVFSPSFPLAGGGVAAGADPAPAGAAPAPAGPAPAPAGGAAGVAGRRGRTATVSGRSGATVRTRSSPRWR